MIETLVRIEGTDYNDNRSVRITRTTGNFNTSSTFEMRFKNFYGRIGSEITVGEEVKVWVKEDATPNPGEGDTALFGGFIDQIRWEGESTNEDLVISGRDYNSLLQDNTVEPIRYTDMLVEDIIDDIIAQSELNITTNLVSTGVMIETITFNHTPIFDAIKDLARRAGCIFYVDSSRVLHLIKEDAETTGLTFTSGDNIKKAKFGQSRRELFNRVWVYGGEVLTGFEDSFTADGGSVYTLSYKPRNTNVYIGGSTSPKIGGILDQFESADPGSPYQYLVDVDNKSVVFVSGANAGDHIPTSGTDSITVEAERSVQIIAFSRDQDSIDKYEKRTKVINERTIKDPKQARELVLQTLDQHSRPFRQGTITPIGHFDVTPGYLATFDVPNHGVDSQDYTILEVEYDINEDTKYDKTHMNLTVNRKLVDGADTIKEMLLAIRRHDQANFDDDQVLTRLEQFYASGAGRTKTTEFQTRDVGSSYVVGSDVYGVIGTGQSPQSYIGDSRGSWVTQWSGTDV